MSWKSALLTAVLALVFGFAGAAIWSATGLGNASTRAYLVENPDILPAMADSYQRQEAERQLASVGSVATEPFPGAVLGNPDGSRVLVEFSDYACGYCRQSVDEVRAMIAADPELKVVIREWPVFEGSEASARMALAAARQGKYAAFHDAMYAAGPPSPESIAGAAKTAGLDMARAEADAASDAVTQELLETMRIAEALGFSGTPSWIAGGRTLEGAVGRAALAEAVGSPGA